MMTPTQARLALLYNPFAGDFGDQADKTLSDTLVHAAFDRPQGACFICRGPIAKGEQHRVHKARIEGEIKQYRMCEKCCIAMADSYNVGGIDQLDAIELRTELGQRRGGALGQPAEPDLTEDGFFAQKQRENIAANSKRAAEADAQIEADRIGQALEEMHGLRHRRNGWRLAIVMMTAVILLALAFRFLAAHHGG